MLGRNILYYYFLNYTNSILGLIFFYLFRIWTPIGIVGQYGYLTSTILIFTFVTDLGFNIAHLKIYPQKKTVNEKASCIGAYIFFQLILILIYVIITVGFILYNGTLYSSGTLILFFSSEFFLLIAKMFQTIFYGENKFIKFHFPTFVNTILKILLLFLYQNITFLTLDVCGILLLIPNIIELISTLILVRGVNITFPKKSLIIEYFMFTLPLFLSNIILTIFNNVDILWIGNWYSNSEVANYYTAKSIFLMIQIMPSTIVNILISNTSKNINSRENKNSDKFLLQINRYLVIIMFLLVIISQNFLAPFIGLILGPDYKLSAEIFNIMLISQLIISMTIVYNTKLYAMDKTLIISVLIIIRTLIGIVFLYLFIYPGFLGMGSYGGAYAIVLTDLVFTLFIRPIYFKKYDFKFYWPVWKISIITLIIILLQKCFNYLYIENYYIIPLLMIINIVIYLLFLRIIGELKKEDFDLIRSLLNFREIKMEIEVEITEEFKIKNDL